MRRHVTLFLFLATLVAFPLLAAGEQYTLFEILIQHPTGIPDDVIKSELRLDAGAKYDADQIEQAIRRVRRLPFVDRATYRVETDKFAGGAQRLIVTIVPMRRLAFTFGTTLIHDTNVSVGTVAPAVSYRTFLGNGTFDGSYGGIIGSGGSGSLTSFAAGYTAYDLFRRGVEAGVAVSRDMSSDEGAPKGFSPSLHFRVPLTLVQSITGNASTTLTDYTIRFGSQRLPGTVHLRQLAAELLWRYETSDDPYFAVSGTDLAVGPTFGRVTGQTPFFTVVPTAHVEVRQRRENEIGGVVRAQHFMPLWTASTLIAAAELTASRAKTTAGPIRFSTRMSSGDVSLVFAHNFAPRVDPEDRNWTPGRHRAEGGVAYRTSGFKQNVFSQNTSSLGLQAGYTYRHPRTLVHITAQFFPQSR